MSGRVYLGFDPGMAGAVAAIYPDGEAVVFDMPTVVTVRTRREVVARELAAIVAPLAAGGDAVWAGRRLPPDVRAWMESQGVRFEKAEALAHSLRAEALRFVQVLDLLGVDFPEQLRVAARAKASPLSKTKTPVAEGERWACACGFRSAGRYPGGHPAKCPLRRVAA